MKTVLIFKTSISKKKQIKTIQPFLNHLISKNGYWNFDLEDCDCILRVESRNMMPDIICKTLHQQGFYCEELH